jgi:predicted metal-dependent phosphoesterase TrpH
MTASHHGNADLHIHTRDGDGLDSLQTILDHVEHNTDLDVIAITEHDNLLTSFKARELWSRAGFRFELVTGEEVTTLDGHLVALFLERPVPSLKRIEETIDAVHSQGGVCFVPHPGSRLTRSVSHAVIRRLHAQKERGTWLDGLEAANAAPTGRFYLSAALRLAAELELPTIGASDAHFRQVIGSAYTSFAGRSAGDLRDSLASGEVVAHQRRYPGLREIGLLRAASVPFFGLRATPKALGWRRTTWSFISRYFAS